MVILSVGDSPTIAQTDLTPTEGRLLQSVERYADLTLDDGTNVRCFEIRLQPQVRIEQNRVGIQQYVRKLLTAGQAVLVNFVPTGANGQPDIQQPWRLTLVAKDTALVDGEIKDRPTNAKRYTYLLGSGQACRTPAERLVKLYEQSTLDFATLVQAFEVETLSKAFFREYKRHYEAFNTYLNGSAFRASVFNGDEKAIRDWTKKLLGRVVFLYFVQKKGWLGASTTDYQDGNSCYKVNFLNDLFLASGGDETFYPNWLSTLFFETLNQPRTDDNFTLPDKNRVKVPFLNGGLFDRDAPDRKGPMTFPPRLFHYEQNPDDPAQRGFLDFLNSYNFTVHEDSPDDHIVAVDPEMLGNIFENLLEDNKDKGAFYTPKAIVHYMCQESLIEYLETALNVFDVPLGHENGQGLSVTGPKSKPGQLAITTTQNRGNVQRTELEDFVTNKHANDFIRRNAAEIDRLLDTVKICDPAIGSGAFPMGMLQEIYQCKLALKDLSQVQKSQLFHERDYDPTNYHARIKLDIIQNSIYGVDIERGAVDIARLRFWLSLVVDEDRPRPLPNLDYKIVVGNSLVSKLDDEILTLDWTLRGFASAEYEIVRLTKLLSQKQRAFFTASGDKATLQREIRDLKIDLLTAQIGLNRAKVVASMPGAGLFQLSGKEQKKRIEGEEQLQSIDATLRKLKELRQDPNKPLPYFDWRLDFSEVLNPHVTTNIGFDIVIGNPPYVPSKEIEENEKDFYYKNFKTADYQINTFGIFSELGVNMLVNKGLLSYIIPNYWLFNKYDKKLRQLLLIENTSIKLVNIYNVFEEATVDTLLLFTSKLPTHSKSTIDLLSIDRSVKSIGERLQALQNNAWHFNKTLLIDSLGVDITLSFESTFKLNVQAKLADFFSFKFGAKLYQVGKGKPAQTSDAAKNKVFENSLKLNEWYMVLLKARSVQRYYLLPTSTYVFWGMHLAEPRPKNLFQGPRILLQRIVARDYLDATFTDEEYLCNTDVITLKPKNSEVKTKFYLAILSSNLCARYIKSQNINLDRQAFPKINTATLESFPVPEYTNNCEIFEILVNQILDAKRTNPAADTSALEAEIDLRAYHLYSLTYAEVLLVEPAFGMSEAEYTAAGQSITVS